MKKITSLLVTLLLFSNSLLAQDAFSSLSKQAQAAYEVKNYLSSGQLFEQAFQQYPARITRWDFYNAACSWALAGDNNKAFQNLDKAISAGWRNSEKLQYDKDLQTLRSDQRWPALVAAARQESAPAQAGLKNPMQQQLEEVFATHQRLRAQKDSIELSAGAKSPQFKKIIQQIEEANARHLQVVSGILDEQG
ncbi:hypothetical protein D0N36_01550 [Hymenobacter lapidiphilus]|uniref:TPR end-of-group domain-containing protein n=1 Tax=Hymenobacter sp. CCM 8763 TaxID=2303334 RepID=UPI000E3532E3|nr:hypothetical protein [Hymenobacter sp. CCM 8763]RFP66797.1 hypothetical protein D0N36_01550 [Hymenobacter sp. CCM 8763]